MKMKIRFFSYGDFVNARMADLLSTVDPCEIKPVLLVVPGVVIGKNVSQPLFFLRKPASLDPHAAQEGVVSQKIVVNHCFILRRRKKRTYLAVFARHVIHSLRKGNWVLQPATTCNPAGERDYGSRAMLSRRSYVPTHCCERC